MNKLTENKGNNVNKNNLEMDDNIIMEYLKLCLDSENIDEIKNFMTLIKKHVMGAPSTDEYIDLLNNNVKIKKQYLIEDINQILETKTIERTKYYINRLKKGISIIKTNKINDINLNRWKEYDDIITDSLWIFNKRDNTGTHSAGYWGNYIPQIPNQLLRRYTKKGEWVLDPFLGSGTTLIECKKLERNGIGIELQKEVVNQTVELLKQDTLNTTKSIIEAYHGDSATIDTNKILKENNINGVQFITYHPPYWDIIKFSDDKRDISNAETLEEFINGFEKIINNTLPMLDNNRYFAITIGDKYCNGEWIPLGYYTMDMVLKKGHKLKSIIVKNFEDTKGKRNQKELWRYRALSGNFYVFKHEYIFLFQKTSK